MVAVVAAVVAAAVVPVPAAVVAPVTASVVKNIVGQVRFDRKCLKYIKYICPRSF